MLDVNTLFTPYCLHLSRREPVDLVVQVRNTGETAEQVSLVLYTGTVLALDKEGLKNREEIKIEKWGPNQTKKWYFRLYGKPNTDLGENPVRLQLLEHFDNDYNLVKRKYNLDLTLLTRK